MAFACRFLNGVGVSISGDGSDTNPYTINANAGSSWGDWVPVLTALTTNPTLGTGSIQSGRFVQDPRTRTVQGWGIIQFGTSGAAAGSGIYEISLPVPAVNTLNVTLGPVMFNDSGTIQHTGVGFLHTSGRLRLYIDDATDSASDTIPFTWTNNDAIRWSFMYEY